MKTISELLSSHLKPGFGVGALIRRSSEKTARPLYNYAAWLLVLAVTAVLLYLLNASHPYFSDDNRYLNIIPAEGGLSAATEPVDSLGDIVESQLNHWFTVNGRAVSHSLLQAVLLLGKPAVNAVNTLIVMLLIIVICKCAGSLDRLSFCLTASFLLLLNPNSTETLAWTTGVCNYTFTILLVLLFFSVYLPCIDDTECKTSIPASLLMLPFGVLAGWTNENIAPSMIFVLLLCLLYRRFICWRRIPVQLLTGLAGSVIGFAMLFFAPANFVRSGNIRSGQSLYSGFMHVCIRLYYMLRAVFNFLFPVLVILLCVYLIYHFFLRRELSNRALVFIIWGALSVAAMVFSPTYPERAAFGSLVISIVAVLIMLRRIISENEKARYCAVLLTAILFSAFIVRMGIDIGYSYFKIY